MFRTLWSNGALSAPSFRFFRLRLTIHRSSAGENLVLKGLTEDRK